jgi:predicted CoA-binding protein
VIPVNPNETYVHGIPAAASLLDLKKAVDIVDVFRRAEYAPEVARQAVQIGARALWLQQGVVSEEAAAIASAAGLVVVMDDCIAVALSLLR